VLGSILDYTITLKNGKMAVPPYSSLDITLSHPHVGDISCGDLPLATNIISAPGFAAGAVVTCTFSIRVTQQDIVTGQAPAITVTASYGLAAAGAIFSVPTATTAAVPVNSRASVV
jgi:hypothetical protein